MTGSNISAPGLTKVFKYPQLFVIGLAVDVDTTPETQVHSAFSAQSAVVPAWQGGYDLLWYMALRLTSGCKYHCPFSCGREFRPYLSRCISHSFHELALQPWAKTHKKKLQRFKDCFFPSITSAVLPHITRAWLYCILDTKLAVFLGKVWTVSVTLKAFSSKCHFIGREASTGKQSTFLEVTE